MSGCLRGHSGAVTALKLNDQVKTLASGAEDGSVRVWDLETRKCKHGIKLPGDTTASSLSFSHNGLLHVAAGNHVYGFDMRTLSLVQDESKAVMKLGPLSEEINTICLSEKDEFLGTSDDAGLVHVFDVRSKSVFKRLRPIHSNLCSAAIFRPKRKWELWSGGMDNQIVRWDFSRGTTTGSFKIPQDETPGKVINPPFVLSLSFSFDGNTLFGGFGDGTIGSFNLQSGQRGQPPIELSQRLDAHSWSVSCLEVLKPLPAGLLGTSVSKPLMSGGLDGNVHIWETGAESLPFARVGAIATQRKINAIASNVLDSSLLIYVGGCQKSGSLKGTGDIEMWVVDEEGARLTS
ncbi:WD repeat-containing protein 53 [Dinochytrium kinnereticum]|nr:WD repeat-containing protein 53 [Dinochytrium kinnereticum]